KRISGMPRRGAALALVRSLLRFARGHGYGREELIQMIRGLSRRDWTENHGPGEVRQPSPVGVAALASASGGNGTALANRPGTGLPSVLASRSVAGASAVADTPVRTADRSSR